MALSPDHRRFLASVHPYDTLSEADLNALAELCDIAQCSAGNEIFAPGQTVSALYLIQSGTVAIADADDSPLSELGPRNSFGERALNARTTATRRATAITDTTLIVVPAAAYYDLLSRFPKVARFFDRSAPVTASREDPAFLPVARVMSGSPVTCPPDTPASAAAALMRDRGISSVLVTEGDTLRGILTVRDISGRLVADRREASLPVSSIMTPAPLVLGPDALVMDVLHLMMERAIGHVPIVDAGRLVGIVSQTDLTRAQALTSAELVRRIARAGEVGTMAKATAEIPQLLARLVAAGHPHHIVTRLITDIADTVTRRLIAMAEAGLGPAPVPYLWLACGSQGRQEQTGVSDQDNCLILSDAARPEHMGYFERLAQIVCDGLHACGYVYCPGEMMASNPRWRQPLAVWQDYFDGWIAHPAPEAQMLASVMFDLRPIAGDLALFTALREPTKPRAAANSIFVAHMIANSLKHRPPLGLLRGLATIRSGEHRNELDLKHNGVVPVVDLGRIFALQGQLDAVNTRARLQAAVASGGVSGAGGADLLDAYDVIATARLRHQARQVASGSKPDNFLDPSDLSDFERSHLRDAFVVVKTHQAALGAGKAMLG